MRKMQQLALLSAVVLLLGACGSAPRKSGSGQHKPNFYRDGAPPEPVDLSRIPEPKPQFEPLARYGNHTPYSVLGRSYVLLSSRAGYLERGVASWYGTQFHGKLTSTREPYDMYAFTAAHKTLPLPTYARVTNLENQKSIIVRINDRGPFVGTRIIDLSYVAALKLGMHQKGTAQVEVASITPGEFPVLLGDRAKPPSQSQPAPAERDIVQPQAASPSSLEIEELALVDPALKPLADPGPRPDPVRTLTATDELVLLQCGAFSDALNANALRVALLDAGFSDARVISGQDRLNRVVIGPLSGRASAQALSNSIQAKGFVTPKIVAQ